MYIVIENPQFWIEKAACKKYDTELFYPIRGQSTAPAKQICFDCPVRTQCCEYSIAISEKLGIWGGCSERERRRIRRVRATARRNGLVDTAQKSELESDEEENIDDEP